MTNSFAHAGQLYVASFQFSSLGEEGKRVMSFSGLLFKCSGKGSSRRGSVVNESH